MTCFTNSIENIAQIDWHFFLPLENNNTALVSYENDAIAIHSTSMLKSPTQLLPLKRTGYSCIFCNYWFQPCITVPTLFDKSCPKIVNNVCLCPSRKLTQIVYAWKLRGKNGSEFVTVVAAWTVTLWGWCMAASYPGTGVLKNSNVRWPCFFNPTVCLIKISPIWLLFVWLCLTIQGAWLSNYDGTWSTRLHLLDIDALIYPLDCFSGGGLRYLKKN